MPRKATDTALTRDVILQTAAQLIAQHGVEAFSMRKLASLLGVNPMAIYYYLPNKEAILQAVVEQALSALPLPEADDWESAIRYAAESYRHFAEAQPELFVYMLTFNRSIPIAFSVDEYLAAALARMGLSAAQIVQIVYFVVNTIAGFTLSEVKGSLGRARDVADVHQAFQDLPPEQFPTIHALSHQITPDDLQPNFELAMRMLIGGVQAQLTYIAVTDA